VSRAFDAASIPKNVHAIADTLRARGHRAWVVGGCVRDVLLGRVAKDWDLATTALPDEVVRAFRRVVPTGIQHGTVTVVLGGIGYEVTTLRGESTYTDGRRPDAVHFVATIDEDLARRDFTVNAIAVDPSTGALVDPWGGLGDLDARVIRAVRDPRERFAEDGLRILRAARFVATLEMTLDPATEAAIPGALATFAKVSAERVRDEWEKACRARRASPAFAVMRRTGMLAMTAPMTTQLDDAVFDLALRRMDGVRAALAMRVGALLGWVDVEQREIDRWLQSLRFSNDDRKLVLAIHAHARALQAPLDGPARRRWLAALGLETALAVIEVARADALARNVADATVELEAAVRADVAACVPLAIRDLAVNGGDLMQQLGVAPGPELGRILAALFERTLDDPSQNDRGLLLEHAAKLRDRS
jgi:tRNA nucleotidyltransferase (CCA-adding enzyme)